MKKTDDVRQNTLSYPSLICQHAQRDIKKDTSFILFEECLNFAVNGSLCRRINKSAAELNIFITYSVMQSDGNSFCGDVVTGSFNKISWDEDNILDQIYKKINLFVSLV